MLFARFPAFGLAASLMIFGLTLACASAHAEQPSASVQQAKVEQLIKLLDDADVRALLATRSAARSPAMTTTMSAAALTSWLDEAQGQLLRVDQALPLVSGEMTKAMAMVRTGTIGPARLFLLLILFVAIGRCAELAFMLVVRNIHGHRPAIPALKPESGLHALGRTVFSRIAPLFVFAVTSIGGSLVLSWSTLAGLLIAPMLMALVAARMAIRLGDLILVPDPLRASFGQTRLVSISDSSSRFWFRRVVAFSSVFFLGWAADGIMAALGVNGTVRALGPDVLSLILLVIGIEIVWRRPRTESHHHWHGIFEWMLTLWLCILWTAWAAGLHVMSMLILYVLLLPPTLKIASSIVRTAFDTPDGTSSVQSPVMRVLVERGVRAGIISLAILWPVWDLQMNTTALAQLAESGKIIRGILTGIIILLVADIVWEVAKALINHRLAASHVDDGYEADAAHSDRLLTLLPIFRNFLAVVISAVAIMMVISAVGIEVGPLIAGAGIFGVAIGFGSQTLVKDVISGIFYMFDDAFRVGEYIQSGTYKGTVESFSLRSVRLRHHRGPIFTVPFGSLGAVENMSRDWVIDKFLISVSYQTDVAVVKKLVKEIGAELLEDPELGPVIIETVKMKGVEQFGDYGINLSFSMTTKPGQQSMVRRRALVMIREAFAMSGIEFASPTVQVGKDGRTDITAATVAGSNLLAQKKSLEQPSE